MVGECPRQAAWPLLREPLSRRESGGGVEVREAGQATQPHRPEEESAIYYKYIGKPFEDF